MESGDNEQQPRRRQWMGCLVLLVLFLGALVIITKVASDMLGVDF